MCIFPITGCLGCVCARSHQFLQEFLEVGGVLTVVEILSVKQASESDKTEALKLLLCVSSAGRQYKEIICEGYGQHVLLLAIMLFYRLNVLFTAGCSGN